MIVRLEKEKQRIARRQLFNDVVYTICHEALKQMQREGHTELSPVEVFLSARNFCDSILELPDIEEGLEDEMNDLEDEAEGKDDYMLILTLATVQLQAMTKRRVGINFNKIIFRIFERLDSYKFLWPLVEQMTDKENERWLEGKRVDLLTYELTCIEKDIPTMDGKMVVASIVDVADGFSADNILPIETALAEVNDKLDGHPFQNELNRLRETRKKKSFFNINIDKVNDIHDNPNVNIGSK